MLRERRSDVRIGYFAHIPFPDYEIFAQLPWRRQIVEGLLGADLVGFQRHSDTTNFLRACRRAAGLTTDHHLAGRRQRQQAVGTDLAGRPMRGIIAVTGDALDDGAPHRWISQARRYAAGLPPK